MRFLQMTVTVALLMGCVAAKTRFETEVQNKLGVVNDRLEDVVKQTQNTSIVAEKIGTLQQTIQTKLVDKVELLHKDVTAGSIRYGGAGWVVLGAAVVVTLFLAAGGLIIWLAMRQAGRLKGLLTLVTGAVQDTSPGVQNAVKSAVERATGNGGPFGPAHKLALAAFTKAAGTFAPGEDHL